MTERPDATVESSDEIPYYPMDRDARCPFDPSPKLRALKETPISRVRIWDGSTPWLVTGYEDQRALLFDHRLSIVATQPGFPPTTPGLLARRSKASTFLSWDDPAHARVRMMLTGQFAIKKMEALRPAVQEITDGLIDKLLAGPKPVNLAEEFSLPIPSLVICKMLGVPYEMHPFFEKNSGIIVSGTADPQDVVNAQQALIDYIEQLVVAKMDDPSDDLLSDLAVNRVKTGDLTVTEASVIGAALLFAGHETSANMISLSTLLLLQRLEQLRDFQANLDDAPLVANAVEELLRYISVVQNGRRRAAIQDVEVAGQTIHAGEGVICAAELANRSEDHFPDPDNFNIRRPSPRMHIAFGYGIHQCLGQPLARIEMQVALAALFRRIPDLRLAVPFDEVQFKEQSSVVYGVNSLPVTW